MNIAWSQSERVFIAEFSSDFEGDLQSVKDAGFRTFGPPSWVWYAPSPGIKALSRLREKRPNSGLTISEEALAIYRPLAEQDAKNAEIRQKAAELNKANKKQKKKQEQEAVASELMPEDKMFITAADLPPMPPSENRYAPPPPPTELCQSCGQPLYAYESKDLCLWCEKMLDDMVPV